MKASRLEQGSHSDLGLACRCYQSPCYQECHIKDGRVLKYEGSDKGRVLKYDISDEAKVDIRGYLCDKSMSTLTVDIDGRHDRSLPFVTTVRHCCM